MPNRNVEIETRLKSKFGFQSAKKKHRWVELRLPDAPVVRTCISHARQTIGQDLEHKMARQIKVSVQYFRGMIDCTRTCEDYYRLLRKLPPT